MSTVRVLVKQGRNIYRLLRLRATSDGSLLLFVDLEPSVPRGRAHMNDQGQFILDPEPSEVVKPYPKFSIHTTGVIHYYPEVGAPRTSTTRIDPLTRLTQTYPVGFLSAPRLPRLGPFDPAKHKHSTAGILEIPEDVSGRVTFAFEIGPNPLPMPPATYGLSLNYELYCLVVRLLPTVPVPTTDNEIEHLIYGAAVIHEFGAARIDEATAEIEYYQTISGHRGHIVLQEDNGSYVVLANSAMASAPKVIIEFDRQELHTEQIPFESRTQQPTHKVRFWICDKGGRNKKDDLRSHIRSIALDSRL